MSDTPDKKPPDEQPESKPPQPSPADRIAAYRFRPGQSGNPKGRPKRLTLSEFAEKLLRTQRTRVRITEGGKTTTVTMSKKRALAERLIQRALQGDMRVIEYLGERIDPKVKTVDRDGRGDGPKIIQLPAGGPWGGRAGVRRPTPPAPQSGGET